jgi:hypothetical protein
LVVNILAFFCLCCSLELIALLIVEVKQHCLLGVSFSRLERRPCHILAAAARVHYV